MCIVIISYPGCDIINFELNLRFLIKLVLHMTENVRTKIYLRAKYLMTFLIDLKGLSLRLIK